MFDPFEREQDGQHVTRDDAENAITASPEEEDVQNIAAKPGICEWCKVKSLIMKLCPKEKKPYKLKPQKKSRAEYQADFRNRLKKDPVAWSEHCSKQKTYSRNWRDRLPPEKLAEIRRKNNERNKNARLRKKKQKEVESTSKCPVEEKQTKKTTRLQQEKLNRSL